MDRGNLLSLNIFHKIHRHETRPLIRTCITKLDLEKKLHVQKVATYHSNILMTSLILPFPPIH